MSRIQGYSVTGSIMTMENLKGPIGNGTRDLPACSTVSRATALPRTPRSIDDCPRKGAQKAYIRSIRIVVRFLPEARDIPRPAVEPNQPPIHWLRGLFPVVKRPGSESDISPPVRSRSRMTGSIPLPPSYAFMA